MQHDCGLHFAKKIPSEKCYLVDFSRCRGVDYQATSPATRNEEPQKHIDTVERVLKPQPKHPTTPFGSFLLMSWTYILGFA